MTSDDTMNRSEWVAAGSGPRCCTMSQNPARVFQLQSREIGGRAHDNRPAHEAAGWSFDRDEPSPMTHHSRGRWSKDNAPKVLKHDASHPSNAESRAAKGG